MNSERYRPSFLSHRSQDLAKALGSLLLNSASETKTDAIAHRSPPPDWENALLRLAEEQGALPEIAREMRGSSQTGHSSRRDGR